jgi:hypothetical protein
MAEAVLPVDTDWSGWLRQVLACYDEALLRQVANKLCRPRNHWPVDELMERIRTALDNPVMLDRRLKDAPVASRQLLALIARSGQPRWPVGGLVELAATLGHDDGLAPVLALLEGGLLMPELVPFPPQPEQRPAKTGGGLLGFDTWVALGTPIVIAPPLVLQRALHEDMGLPGCPGASEPSSGPGSEADGLEWPLRLAVLWQQVLGGPLRRTQQGDYFKRDHDRLRGDPLLSSGLSDGLTALPDIGFFAAALATAVGVLEEGDAELHAGSFGPAWSGALPGLIAELWSALPRVTGWNAAQGQRSGAAPGNPYPSAYLLAVLLLTRLEPDAWADPTAIEDWLGQHHPYWREQKQREVGAAAFLLGVAYPLRLLQARKVGGGWHVRLSPLGRWVLGEADPPTPGGFPRTLLVQPNLEILAYRQGLTPELLVRLSRLATWKALGAACTLQLEPQSVYRALEAGETFESLVQLLEQHGMKTMPAPVLDSLRTWSNKRERLGVYAAAALFEFSTPEDLTEALNRGLPAVRLTDRVAVVANEKDIDYRHFRLTGTRDYCLPPERCVDVDADGVTLSVDLARSDLLLESEVSRFAEPIVRPATPGRRLYRLTPASVAAGRQNGLSEAALDRWFQQRSGQGIAPAARLLLMGSEAKPLEMRRELVLYVGSEELADGLQQWPGTRGLIVSRIGPTALVVADENVTVLEERLRELGVGLVRDQASG